MTTSTSRRKTIYLAGSEHKAPIPAAAVVAGVLMSSAINGRDPDSGDYPDDAREQVRNAFANIRLVLDAAGGDTGDIVRMTVFLRERDDRKYVDESWLEMFPDRDDRPARHALPLQRGGKALVQLEIVAVLDDGRGSP